MILAVHDRNGVIHHEDISTPEEFITRSQLTQKMKEAEGKYIPVVCTFDIETTSVVNDVEQYAFMYHWQMCIEWKVVFGSTWEEWMDVIRHMDDMAKSVNKKFVIYVHNLGFEFQFMRNFLEDMFGNIKVFARDVRKPIYVQAGNIEFRCSMFLSNMSLETWTKEQPKVRYAKYVTDDFKYNYAKYRDDTTPAEQNELEYDFCDVYGLAECIQLLLKDDTLETIPYTSTGYVRREAREAMALDKHYVKDLSMTPRQYQLAKKVFRGGNSSCDSLYVGSMLENIESFDLTSSYPASMICDKYPMSKFMEVNIEDEMVGSYGIEDIFGDYCNTSAVMAMIHLENVEQKDMDVIPYLTVVKCVGLCNTDVYGNGRVIRAKDIYTYVTDIDYNILKAHYDFDLVEVKEMYVAKYGYLPTSLRKFVFNMFNEKCKYDIERKKYKDGTDERDFAEELYIKYKNRINSCYGMMVTDIVADDITYNNGEWGKKEVDVAVQLDKYYKNHKSFLCYQWGVWVTANARKRLQNMLDIVGRDAVYIDTDSIKCFEGHYLQFYQCNKRHEEMLNKLDIVPIVELVKADGTQYRKVLGAWEYEGSYQKFITYGTKKYCYIENNRLHLTLAGVNKKKGAKYLESKGGIDKFEYGLVFPEGHSGRQTAWYVDDKIHLVESLIDGHTFLSGSSIALADSTYTLGITDTYEELLVDLFCNPVVMKQLGYKI